MLCDPHFKVPAEYELGDHLSLSSSPLLFSSGSPPHAEQTSILALTSEMKLIQLKQSEQELDVTSAAETPIDLISELVSF